MEPDIAKALLDSAAYAHERRPWFCRLFLLMPDHWHALLVFPPGSQIGVTIGRWKAWQKRTLNIEWQENFFDHRIRDEKELILKETYIRQNPVVKQLCQHPLDWPWVWQPEAVDRLLI